MNLSSRSRLGAWLAVLALAAAAALPARSAMAAAQTQNLGYIDSLTVVNGGTFPTTDPAFAAFNFYQLPIADITAAGIGPGGDCGAAGCDTILLNVASTGINCDESTALSSAQESVLVNFVQAGGKLIIYDSECDVQDYSWLPYQFTTSNPGAQGAQGTLTIVENNILSSDNSADPSFIDAGILASQTDAIGDMNVMTTQDADWCLDMTGTNAVPATGPVQTYARYGSGLIIYNGMDVDVLSSNTVPDTTDGAGNLASVWLYDLQAPFDPVPAGDLPCGATVVGITLAPASATRNLAAGETQHTVTAEIRDVLGNPQAGVAVTFTVTSGPNAGASGTCDTGSGCLTASDGQVAFTYTSNGTAGTDQIVACYLPTPPAAGVHQFGPRPNQGEQCSQIATVTWTSPGQDVVLDGSGGAGGFGPLLLAAGFFGLWLLRRRR